MLTRPDGTVITSEQILALRERANHRMGPDAVTQEPAWKVGKPCRADRQDGRRFIGADCAYCGLPREQHVDKARAVP